ncbi:MAG: O-methyltransferase [Flavisolibacter sp.]
MNTHELIPPAVENYIYKYLSPENELLAEISAFTIKNHPRAQMLSGHMQGKFLEMVSSMIQPQRILEVGTFTGYSAICLAKGLSRGGMLHTIELRPEEAVTARNFFDKSAYKDLIKLHTGEALKIIGELNETWDLVFIDADKEQYIEYFNLILPKVRQNGYILADNVLFHGAVLEPKIKGKNAKAIQAFNDYILTRGDVDKIILPIRDGLMLLKKKY